MSDQRKPCVAGRFYPGDHDTMMDQARGFLAEAGPREEQRTVLAMAPHAGWIFSGGVCGRTLGRANLADTVLLLGPKHTPDGAMRSVWSGGDWTFPGLEVGVDDGLRTALLDADQRLEPDTAAHLQEHSIEVIVPFLAALNPGVRIVPVALWERDPAVLVDLGAAMGRALVDYGAPVSMVVSSDMSHMLPDDQTRRLDRLALEQALALDPTGLFETVAANRISMCGVVPMTAGLAAARELGASRADLVGYATSGDVTGDKSQVVGYAGVLVR